MKHKIVVEVTINCDEGVSREAAEKWFVQHVSELHNHAASTNDEVRDYLECKGKLRAAQIAMQVAKEEYSAAQEAYLLRGERERLKLAEEADVAARAELDLAGDDEDNAMEALRAS